MGFSALVASALCTFLLPLLLFLAAVKLWDLYCVSGRDRSCPLPLPPGTMGLPFFGETLQMVLQRRKFLQMKRRKYGFIYKTHLFGRPTVRVMGAENVRHILLGEHRLVSVQWPASVRTILGSGCLSNLHNGQHKHRKKVRSQPRRTGGGRRPRARRLNPCPLPPPRPPGQVIMRAFSRDALQHYVPVIQEEVSACLARWLRTAGPCLLVYPEVKRLMFRIAMRILLGFQPRQAGPDGERQLVEAFEEMIRNLFSLPIDVPFSGLYRGLRARNIIHAKIEENIRAKMACKEPEGGYKDALQLLMEHTQGNGEQLNMQELKESATELLFGGHETTASAATSLIAFLGLHHDVLQKVRKELQVKGLLCSPSQEKQLDMEVLEQLKYTGCVIKETLRLSPPVPGGFRVALKTLELNGYQIPKGWNVIYSICDTHDVADLFTDKDEFNPDRFMSPSPEDSSRFSFIPFGGGLRSCVGKEFAKVLLKIFTVELARSCDWQLLNGPPTMKTGPIVYPVDNLPTKFIGFSGQI
ncbi:cytochrome P450 26A1 isoform X1 [Cuculus canorus]|uniref:cytochrome P450 26A1 isoform X1 n=1 Tax=Cuculus canorus TaxID=55661 RepID=UPI0023AB0544|nr:cytochrome P450 26A1 isoform X1 [Cuculus canorus]